MHKASYKNHHIALLIGIILIIPLGYSIRFVALHNEDMK